MTAMAMGREETFAKVKLVGIPRLTMGILERGWDGPPRDADSALRNSDKRTHWYRGPEWPLDQPSICSLNALIIRDHRLVASGVGG